MIMVPALVELLKYRKGNTQLFDKMWDKIGEIPVKATLLVILVALVVTGLGVAKFTETMGQEITGGPDEVPPNLESYETLREYSAVFEGGQTNMFIINAEERGSVNGTAPIRDLPILDSISLKPTVWLAVIYFSIIPLFIIFIYLCTPARKQLRVCFRQDARRP